MLETERLHLRKWREEDAASMFLYAKDPDVGPAAGWPPHKSVEESLNIIRTVFQGKECYAICEKGKDEAIGAIELKLNGHTDVTDREDECELGYWLGKPFWGIGYMPEAARELIRRGFEDLGMQKIWCCYYDGNEKSKRVQEKVGFVYDHTCKDVEVPLLHEVRTDHRNVMTREHWEEITFRKMRSWKQELGKEECVEILKNEPRGVLSVLGENGYPYGIPMDHWYDEKEGKLYFHGAKTGHKIDAIAKNDKVSYCVFDQGYRKEGEWALNIRSVVVFGKMQVVEDAEKIAEICTNISRKFTDDETYAVRELASSGKAVCCLELTPEHMTGKLVNEA